MKVLKHLLQQPFVAATGAAALVHSTWALGTLFAGEQPSGWALLGWLLPALLIAFALDVGQIVTSADIRERGLTVARGITFIVFAGATYYLQWLYIAHHMPALDIAAGVSPIARATAVSMRDAALWIIPALLPLSTLLYTFSGGRDRNSDLTIQVAGTAASVEIVPVVPISPETSQRETQADQPERLPMQNTLPIAELASGLHLATCTACGWEKSYSAAETARRALAAHQSRHCAALHLEMMTNGHKGEKQL